MNLSLFDLNYCATKSGVDNHLSGEIDDKMRDAVMTHGKLLVRVFADGAEDPRDATPIQES